MKRLAFSTAVILGTIATGGVQTPLAAATTVCSNGTMLSVVDPTSGLPAACSLPRDTVLAQSLYYQNASKVGGSALAAYPMLDILAGVNDRTEVLLDAPSQIALSGPNGTGRYPMTSAGFGLKYELAESSNAALEVGMEARPPLSPFATNTTQGTYALNMASLYRVSGFVAVDGSLSGLVERFRGSNRVLPTMNLGVSYDIAPSVQIATDVGSRALPRFGRSQKFGDVSVTHILHKNLAFDTGLGTAFNATSNAKAHYLSAGLDIRN
jgi:hypothetical protein